jgi:hypothetical protein
MNMPGFTAEASLYKITGRYAMAFANTMPRDRAVVKPQQWIYYNLRVECKPCHPYYDKYSICDVYQRICDFAEPPYCRVKLLGRATGPCCEYFIV